MVTDQNACNTDNYANICGCAFKILPLIWASVAHTCAILKKMNGQCSISILSISKYYTNGCSINR